MTFTDSVRTCLRKKYVTFSGRASRSEYWWFILFNILVMIGSVLILAASGLFNSIDPVTGTMDSPGGAAIVALILCTLVYLAMILPSISVGVRRFHDRNLSGWWYLGAVIASMIPFIGILVCIAILVITILKGTEGPNKFGPDPLGVGDAEIFN